METARNATSVCRRHLIDLFAGPCNSLNASSWWQTLPANAKLGKWTFEVDYQSESYTHEFFVSTTSGAPEPGVELGIAAAPGVGGVNPEFNLPAAGNAVVRVFDVSGREAAVLADGAFAAGTHRLRWRGPAGGVYFRASRSEDR